MTDVTNGRGGKRPGAGRPEGAKNKVTVELGEAARAYTPLALQTLANICEHGTTEQARITAATAPLDRGYGKPKQAIEPVQVNVGPIATPHIEAPSVTLAWLESVIPESGGREALPPPRQLEEKAAD
jgi:hypothetical protein